MTHDIDLYKVADVLDHESAINIDLARQAHESGNGRLKDIRANRGVIFGTFAKAIRAGLPKQEGGR